LAYNLLLRRLRLQRQHHYNIVDKYHTFLLETTFITSINVILVNALVLKLK
jgi:hypothetical protein